MPKVGFIGCGNMGGALASVVAKNLGGQNIITADHHQNKMMFLHDNFGSVIGTSADIAQKCQYIFLGVKPQVMVPAIKEIDKILATRNDHYIIVSMAAGLSVAQIQNLVGECAIIRIMPNTPIAVGEGVVLYCTNNMVSEEDEQTFLEMLATAGLVVKVDESKIDAGCAISGCGPAYVCMFLDAMVDGAIRCGLPKDTALALSLQTVIGTGVLAKETEHNPSLLKLDVCSPAGSTIEGVTALERNNFRFSIIDAITVAYQRTKDMSKE